MNNFNWAKALGYGVALWVILFVVAAIIAAGLNLELGIWAMLVLAVIAGAVAYFFGLEINPQTSGQAFAYGAAFAAIGLLLDLLVSRQFTSGIFGIWTYWLGYVFILFAPLTAVGSQQPTHHAV